jgi:hypothetical protein
MTTAWSELVCIAVKESLVLSGILREADIRMTAASNLIAHYHDIICLDCALTGNPSRSGSLAQAARSLLVHNGPNSEYFSVGSFECARLGLHFHEI